MPSTFDQAFEQVQQLAADFKANEKFYLSPAYQEAEARRDFIDKFLIALGWDVNHDTQKNPYEQEVKVERKEHGVSQRRADYAFYMAPNFRDVRFYIEAKKPYGDIATADNYFQVIRYGCSGQTPIAALFDFEQFEIVDCRFKPDVATALQRNLKKYHYAQYADKEIFAEIYWLFSREAVAGGSLEKYAETLPKTRGAVQRGLLKGGYQSFDEVFLAELDGHRETLARIFKNNNPHLDGEMLTEITQRTLDRLVFIRFLEDKLIEPQYLVSEFGKRGSVWGDFIAASRRLDGIYNGIVFKRHEILDAPTLKIDDEKFRAICEELCHKKSPYDFNAIPIHILGSIYERFLGKVIVATDKRVKVEEKPEVRKAGGVYYTPEYIVRYIVENTVGTLIKGKTPAQIAEMRFADIACGSGSFLLGVYDLLLRYHTKYYNDNPGKAKKGETIEREDGLHLSLQKKREILTNNIYGVDIDNQAVEVAQLSLYLKLLQDETPASARNYQSEFIETLLPSLAKNIVCGNSLISTDISSGELFEPVAERKLNPMDFAQRFPHVMKRGGFDAIVGNPPYVRQEGLREQKAYFLSHYTAFRPTADLYVNFIERGIRLLNPKGLFGMIVSNKWLRAAYGEPLRKFLANDVCVEQILDFAGLPVFTDATVRTIILICSPQKKAGKFLYLPPMPLDDFRKLTTGKGVGAFFEKNAVTLTASNLSPKGWSLSSDKIRKIIKRVQERTVNLKSYVKGEPYFGIKTGFNEAFVIDGETRAQLISEDRKSAEIIKPLVVGRDVRRYMIEPKSRFLIWTYIGVPIKKYPAIFKHLKRFQPQLEKRWDKGAYWWELRACDYYGLYTKPKIIYPDISTTCRFALDREGYFGANTTYFIPGNDLYLLGLLNSRFAQFYFTDVCAGLEGGGETYLRFFGQYMEEFPVRPIDPASPDDKTRHGKIVSLVEQMLPVQKQLAGAQSDKDKDFYENKCASLDRQIDALVYELYDLTADEIKIVEGAAT